MTYIPDVWTARNDGSGSGLDADKLDNIDSTAFLQDITAEDLETLQDVTITAIASGELLKWNGSIWINQTLAEAGIQAAGSYLTDITGEPLSDLSDVTISAIATGEILKWNGSIWINNTLAEAGIQAAGSYLTDITGEPLSDLSDVTITAIADGEILRWNGSIWINNTLSEAGIQAAGEVADLTYAAKTSAYTLVLTDDVVSGDSSGGTFTLTLPTASGNTGKLYHLKKVDSSANVVTVDGNAAETIDGAATVTLDVQWHALTIVSDGTNWLVI